MSNIQTVSAESFRSLLAEGDFQSEHSWEETSTGHREEYEDEGEGGFETREITTHYGWAEKVLSLGDARLTFTFYFSYDEENADSLDVGVDNGADLISLAGAVVLDEDGDPISDRDLEEHFDLEHLQEAAVEEFREAIAPTIEHPVDADSGESSDSSDDDEDDDEDLFEVLRDNEPNITFTGERLVNTSSSQDRIDGDRWSGSTGRWTTLRLYRTTGGKFVAQRIGHTMWEGERTRYAAKVCETEDEVKGFFGMGWLAKDLYEDAEIDATEHVD
jgi:hypothetical protein